MDCGLSIKYGLGIKRWGRFRETSPVAESKEKWMFSQANWFQVRKNKIKRLLNSKTQQDT